jgi:hypothetical protein
MVTRCRAGPLGSGYAVDDPGRYREASLWVIRDNAPAVQFYRRAGMIEDVASEKYFELGGNRVKEVRYSKQLSARAREV